MINTASTADFPIVYFDNMYVPLEKDGHTVLNRNNKRLKHRFKIGIPLAERDMEPRPDDYKKYKVTVGRVNCEIEPASYGKSADGIGFSCLADFNTANPLYRYNEKPDVIVETIPYGYTYVKQNAVTFLATELSAYASNGQYTPDVGYHRSYTKPINFTPYVSGKWKIEAIGANGGPRTVTAANANLGGLGKAFLPGIGGYSVGYKYIPKNTKLLIFPGGIGSPANDTGSYSTYDTLCGSGRRLWLCWWGRRGDDSSLWRKWNY